MKRKMVKMMIVTLIGVMAITMIATGVDATMTSEQAQDPSNLTENAEDTSGAARSINRILQAALTITQVIGVGVAIIMLIVLAIKYISASPGDKADIKKHAVVYVVGAIILFAASGILQIIKNFAKNIYA